MFHPAPKLDNHWRFTGRAYCIAVLSLPQSVESAQRCVESAKKFGVEVKVFEATTKPDAPKQLQEFSLKWTWKKEIKSDLHAVWGCFLSHFRLWRKCMELNEPILVLEHDAIFTANIPDFHFDSVLNLGKPSWGKNKAKGKSGLGILSTKKLYGTHGYLVSPTGAKKMIEFAQENGISPADEYMNRRSFPFIQEWHPHPIFAKDEFSSIQKTDLGRGYETAEMVWTKETSGDESL